MPRGQKSYASIEEFYREEIRSHIKLGWSLDDLESEANIHRRVVDEEDEGDPRELNFDF